MTNTKIDPDRIAGSLYGSAYGDAIGYPTEFIGYDDLVRRGVRVPDELRVSDDTQMQLEVIRALRYWHMHGAPEFGVLRQELFISFQEWMDEAGPGKPLSRAPGVTCCNAIRELSRVGLGHWIHGTGADSSGCGSVMRAAWVGLDARLDDAQVETVAMMQAVLTHAPAENAYCSAALASLTRALATGEVELGGCAEWLRTWTESYYRDYDVSALSNVHTIVRARRGGVLNQTREDYVRDGLSHTQWMAGTAQSLTHEMVSDGFWAFDPCEIGGQGWRAREAVALAVGIADALAACTEYGVESKMGLTLDAEAALLRAATTNGDSDSIAAITGALVGAAWGVDAFPSDWGNRLEDHYREELFLALEYLGNA